MAFRWMASAPNLPRPRNVSGGLWYTLASEPTSLSSCSKSCSDNVLFDIDITGLSDKTTACGKRLIRLMPSQCTSMYFPTKIPNQSFLISQHARIPWQLVDRSITTSNKYTPYLSNPDYRTLALQFSKLYARLLRSLLPAFSKTVLHMMLLVATVLASFRHGMYRGRLR